MSDETPNRRPLMFVVPLVLAAGFVLAISSAKAEQVGYYRGVPQFMPDGNFYCHNTYCPNEPTGPNCCWVY